MCMNFWMGVVCFGVDGKGLSHTYRQVRGALGILQHGLDLVQPAVHAPAPAPLPPAEARVHHACWWLVLVRVDVWLEYKHGRRQPTVFHPTSQTPHPHSYAPYDGKKTSMPAGTIRARRISVSPSSC